MNPKWKRGIWLLFRLSMAALIIGLLFSVAGWAAIRTAFVGMQWSWMVAVYGSAILVILVNAWLLRFLLGSVGLQVSFGRVLLAKFQSTFVALVLPGDVFAGIAKWANLSAATGDKAGVLSALIFGKIALAVPPILVGSIVLTAWNPFPESDIAIVAACIAIALTAVTTMVLHGTSGRILDRLATAASKRAPAFVQNGIQAMLGAIRELRTLNALDYFVVLGLSTLIFVLSILSMFFAALAVDVTMPVSAFLWVGMFLFISRLLPLTVGNLGVREGILVFSFGVYGVDPAKAILVGLLMFSSVLFVAVIGAAYQVAIAMGWLDWKLDKESRDSARTARP
jgi:uncharacterized membrane protein YbhN (UPF0104 family)